jgi:RimJ/RimL family protein N-acetyltransferase
MNIRLRPFEADELDILREIARNPDYAPLTWVGFRPVEAVIREHGENGLLGDEVARLVVEVDGEQAGFMSYLRGRFGVRGDYYEIGIMLRPEFRGRGIGWRAQALLTAYVFDHFPVQRVQAGTQADNAAERKALLKAGFREEGVIRAAEFRAGQWRDGVIFSRLRDDPYPELDI